MRKCDTALKEKCRYLVRRPTEVFLSAGETAPQVDNNAGLSQEELLKQPVYVPHRAKKDPREIKILDPASAKKQWLADPKPEQLTLFPKDKRPREQMSFFDLSGITDEQFWNEAEARLLEALREYATRVANGGQLLRQLFSDDAARGFALVDISRKQFDVLLMNPPFGEASRPAKSYIERAYPRTKNDVYAAFVERWLGKLTPGGMLGAITSRTGFFLSSFQKWREEILLIEARPVVFADLGYGVLDTAMVETAAYCLARN